MTILELVSAETSREEPRVWIGRIALFESLAPPTLVRDPIEFTTGLNVVWGMEDESDSELLEPGHGVGKTTLCRLIRYCLGEPNYGQAHAETEILHTFPNGYVAAEVHLQGQAWSVLRPFDKHRSNCAQPDVSIEELVQNRPPRASFSEYRDQLSRVCLDGFRTESVLIGGASIQWGHLLAMCARDQEARYQSLWQWRSPRSDSGPPKIQKEDAFLTLRSVLGLLPDEETMLQQRLAALDSELSVVEREIAERRREPDYWVRYYRRSLQDDFHIDDATAASLDAQDMFSLPRVVDARVAKLHVEQAKRLEELAVLDRKIAMAAAAWQEPAELQEQEQTAAEVTETGTDVLLASLEELRQLRQQIAEAELSYCRYGQIAIGDCTHAHQQLAGLDDQIRDAQKSTLPTSAKRDQAVAALKERVQRRTVILQRLRDQLNKLTAARRELDDERRRVDTEITRVQSALANLVHWDRLQSGQQPDTELAQLVARQQKLNAQSAQAKERLAALLTAQDQQIIGLRGVYEALVRRTLSPEFKGRVRLSRDGLEFRVFRGENLSGEAFETLAVLLADLAVMMMGALDAAKHPGFLIHDSPREADLGGQIYGRLLVCISDVAKQIGTETKAPFQYIVTTTTPPPTGLKNKSTTRLKLGGEAGQLFGRQLHAETEHRQLPLRLSDEGIAARRNDRDPPM